MDPEFLERELTYICEGQNFDGQTGELFKRRMHTLSHSQSLKLKHEYLCNAEWTKDKIEELATELDLPVFKVYKWHYDQ